MADPKEEPLKDEQLHRDKWRGGETFVDDKEAAGHTEPESERDRATDRSESGRESPSAPPVINPPD